MTDKDYPTSQTSQKIALEKRAIEAAKQFSPSANRNKEAIKEIYLRHMPLKGRVLEVGSGTGEHACHILPATPDLIWQPSDPDENARASINAWAAALELSNLLPALDLDMMANPLPISGQFDAIVSINMIHIADWAAVEGLFTAAGNMLQTGSPLFLYGPFMRNGVTAESNHDFDHSLKERHLDWGVRDIDRQLIPLGTEHNLALSQVIDMPKNNNVLLFTKI